MNKQEVLARLKEYRNTRLYELAQAGLPISSRHWLDNAIDELWDALDAFN
jgi:hypothetical protein